MEEKQFHHHFHYFEQNDQYRIESPPVRTGGLKKNNYLNVFKKAVGLVFNLKTICCNRTSATSV